MSVEKYFEYIDKLRKNKSQAYILKNIDIMRIDLNALAKYDEALFIQFFHIFSGKYSDDKYIVWEKYKKAFVYFKKYNILEKIQENVDTYIKNKIKDIEKKYIDICRVPKHEIDAIIIKNKKTKKQKNISSVLYMEFCQLINKYYEIDIDDIITFDEYYNQCVSCLKIQENNDIFPKDKEDMIEILDSVIYQRNMFPMFRFWSYLCDYDFFNIENDSYIEMSHKYIEIMQEDDEDEKNVIEKNIMYKLMKNIFLKELMQCEQYKQKNKIIFYVSW